MKILNTLSFSPCDVFQQSLCHLVTTESKQSRSYEFRENIEVILNRATDRRRVQTLTPWSLYPQG